MAYSLDLRQRVLSSYESGEGTQSEIADFFDINISTLKRWLTRKKSGDSLIPQKGNRGRPGKINAMELEELRQIVEAKPSITLAELSALYLKKRQISIGSSVLSRALIKLNLRYKKLSIKAIEREAEEVKKKR